jgi:ferredoxin
LAYKIAQECVSCGACRVECPNQAISLGEATFIINPERCTECIGSTHAGPRCAEVCPVHSPKPDAAHKDTRDQLLSKWKKLHPETVPGVK